MTGGGEKRVEELWETLKPKEGLNTEGIKSDYFQQRI